METKVQYITGKLFDILTMASKRCLKGLFLHKRCINTQIRVKSDKINT